MAWLNGRWVERKERAEIISTYRDYLAVLDERYPSIDDMTAEVLADYFEKTKELERLERIHRCEVDLIEFAIEYFSEAKNPGNAGNWEGFDVAAPDDAAQFHKEICAIMNEVSTTKPNAKTAVAAPRGHGKSSWLTKGFPLHETVFRKRKYIIIISETPSVSVPNLEWLSNQLKHNEKLRKDFGPLLSPKQQENPKDNSVEFIAWEPRNGDEKRQLTRVEAASTGQALRGRNWNGSRPDLVICDDLEDAKTNASTPEQRQKLREWMNSVVIPLGDPKGERTAFVYMGTTVAPDSLLIHILYKRSDFDTKVFRALKTPPDRTELWEQFRKIYTDRENANRREDALAFYHENKEEMDRGSEVLWPEVQPLLKLMMWKYDNGSKAFNTEYQNNPVDEESMIFNPETFTYWDGKDIENRHLDKYMGIDFAMGKKERGDYSAITIIGRDNKLDTFYVLDSWGDRVKPNEFIDVIVSKVIEHQPDYIAAEAQMAQEFFVDELKKALSAAGYPAHTRVKKIQQRQRKELRIEAMLPDIENGRIQFSRRHGLLLEQFELYGQSAHDDLPDSMAMALSIGKKSKIQLKTKPAWL